jgi:hypothetical protein
MKNILINKLVKGSLGIGIIGIVFLTSCDKGFERMNKNPNAFTEPVPGNLFTTAIIREAGVGTADRNRVNIKHLSGMIQYMATLQTFWYGEKYIYNDQGGNFFETEYPDVLKELQQLFPIVKDDPELVNDYAMIRIWRVFILHRVTDLYGDVPYTEAAQGYINGIYKAKYDKQSDIYADMLKELDEAAQQFDPSKSTFGSADILYHGDVSQWKTFAYSLMLRLAMRLTKVDPQMAETWVKKALAGGVMQSNADMAMISHSPDNGNNWNWDSHELKRESLPDGAKGTGNSKLSKAFVDMLQQYDDPRLSFYGTLWQGNVDPNTWHDNSDPAKQKGLPNGYDQATIKDVIPSWNNDMLKDYSEPNLNTVVSLSSPTVFLSYAEIEFLRAEAALRGWDNNGTAAEHYNKAVTASMESTIYFPGDFVISSAQIQQYLAMHPLTGSQDNQMEQIYTQFWLANFMWFDFFEEFATWRRTGYPILHPVNYPGNATGGTIPRRLRYPQSESALNTENYNAAVAEQGPDLMTTRVWWDKK